MSPTCLLPLFASIWPARALTPRTSSLRTRTAASASAPGGTLDALSASLPFLDAGMYTRDARYSGLGVTLTGREACAAAAHAWRDTLPSRLRNFAVDGMTVLPPDARNVIVCRYRLCFDAPVPPAVLPGQRRRLDAANLRIDGGRTRVTAVVAASLRLDRDGSRVCRHEEALVADPLAVGTSIAHFELLSARSAALQPGGQLELLREPLAYWSALRGMMRVELDEIRRRSESDEAAVLGGEGGVSDDEFEAAFRAYMVRIFAIGFVPPLAAFALAKVLLRVASDSVGLGAGGGG